jgi:hypothetical protein
MAYRAKPHSTVKYSPYYLVCSRELRLSIDDDWKPQSKAKVESEIDYERHVCELAGRLHEAQEEARKQSTLRHEKAKKYYDRGTKEMQLKKGDLVYLHNSIADRSKAKEFAYKYQGPYVIGKISPLVYKLQVDADKSVIVHQNGLKRAYQSSRSVKETGSKSIRDRSVTQKDKPEHSKSDDNSQEGEGNMLLTRQLIDKDGQSEEETENESPEMSPTRDDRRNPARLPETRYFRR